MSVEPSYSIVCNYETVATFREMRSVERVYNLVREYAKEAYPVRYATLKIEGQKILGCYYTRRATQNPDSGKWKATWEDADGKPISAKEAREMIAFFVKGL